jgi:hypothetical protein
MSSPYSQVKIDFVGATKKERLFKVSSLLSRSVPALLGVKGSFIKTRIATIFVL